MGARSGTDDGARVCIMLVYVNIMYNNTLYIFYIHDMLLIYDTVILILYVVYNTSYTIVHYIICIVVY